MLTKNRDSIEYPATLKDYNAPGKAWYSDYYKSWCFKFDNYNRILWPQYNELSFIGETKPNHFGYIKTI